MLKMMKKMIGYVMGHVKNDKITIKGKIMRSFHFIFLLSNLFISAFLHGAIIRNGGNLQMGDDIMEFCLAKLLSMKYDVPLYHTRFRQYQLFKLDLLEQKLSTDDPPMYQKMPNGAFPKMVKPIVSDNDVIAYKNEDALLYTTARTYVSFVSPEELAILKSEIQLKKVPPIKPLPQGIITVAVHIRRGNGGGQHYDGELSSQQLFDYDRSQVLYRSDFEYFPFDYEGYQRKNGHLIRKKVSVDRVNGWETRFPPLQFFIDQIKKLSDDLENVPLYVAICTDDRDPINMIEMLKQAVNKPNIIFDYEDQRHLSYLERVWYDLYILSRTDVLIRSQSNFSKAAELMGNHKLIIYPLTYQWNYNKLIMTQIVVNGSLSSLKSKKEN